MTANKPTEHSTVQVFAGCLFLIMLVMVSLMLACASAPAETLEELEEAVRKELRPNKDVKVTVGQRSDGFCFVFATYKPLLREVGPIEGEMMDAYKTIYTSDLPVIRAEIQAWATLVDQYGQPFESIIYSSQLDGEAALPVNWEKLYLVTPSRVFSDAWSHPAIR